MVVIFLLTASDERALHKTGRRKEWEGCRFWFTMVLWECGGVGVELSREEGIGSSLVWVVCVDDKYKEK